MTHNGRPRYSAPTLPRIAALYARVSSVAQGEDGKASLSLPRCARMQAERLGYATCPEFTYVERHSGEELYERPELSRLREDAKRRPHAPFGLVLCYSVERLARNSAYVQIVLDEWERLGIGLQFATEELENTPLGRAIMNMRAFAGEVESERRKDRVHRALMARVAAGKPISGKRPNYGYNWADERRHDGRLARERMVENLGTAPVLRRIFALADAGQTQRQIAGLLTSEQVPRPDGTLGAWDPSTIHYFLLNPIYWGEPETLKRHAVPVDKAVRHLYRKRVRLVPRPAEERVALPSTIAPALVSKELAERVHARLAQNQYYAPRNNRQPDASFLRGLVYCGVCGAHMAMLNEPNRGQRDRRGQQRRDTGPQFRCHTGTRIMGRIDKCRTGGNSIMAAKLDAATWAEMICLFETPGALTAELQAARTRAHAEHTEAAQPVDDLTSKIADAERRLAGLRKMAELIDNDDERQAYAARITLLARDRDTWARELAGRQAAAARLRLREEAIIEFQQHVAAEHGSMETWAGHFMRQLMLICDARVEVWPLRNVQSGKAEDRAVLDVKLPLTGERRAALTRLLRDEHVLAAVESAHPTVEDGGNGDGGEDGGNDGGTGDCAERALACSRMSTPVSTRRSGALRPLRNSAM
jgi:DNA invertase Pin-like site-specific DNA recombinase